MRQRLRDGYTRTALDELYKDQHQHSNYPDHLDRVAQTIAFAVEAIEQDVADQPYIYYIGDLSCGDAAIPQGIWQHHQEKIKLYLGDLTPGWPLTGTIGETLPQLPHAVNLYVCCETLEHVDNPDAMLREIRFHAGSLLMSTPVDNFDDDNDQHIWAWSKQAVEEMLTSSGWQPVGYRAVNKRPEGFPYNWGIWFCR